MVLQEACLVLIAGLLGGLILALAVGRAGSFLLFGLQPYDPPTLATAGIVLALVVIAASCLPAWRAANVDPVSALRQQ